jgi:hypothetical protein
MVIRVIMVTLLYYRMLNKSLTWVINKKGDWIKNYGSSC